MELEVAGRGVLCEQGRTEYEFCSPRTVSFDISGPDQESDALFRSGAMNPR